MVVSGFEPDPFPKALRLAFHSASRKSKIFPKFLTLRPGTRH